MRKMTSIANWLLNETFDNITESEEKNKFPINKTVKIYLEDGSLIQYNDSKSITEESTLKKVLSEYTKELTARYTKFGAKGVSISFDMGINKKSKNFYYNPTITISLKLPNEEVFEKVGKDLSKEDFECDSENYTGNYFTK